MIRENNKIKTQKKLKEFNEFLSDIFPEDYQDLDGADSATVLKHIPHTVTFQVTDACNLCCTYCYQINKGHHSMTFNDARKFIDKLLAGEFENYLPNAPGVIIEFIGGEPFLEVDLIDRITDYFRLRTIELNHPWAEKYSISICTNGTLYNDPKVQKYLVKNKNHLSLSITIDGTKKLHNSCRVFPDGTGSYDIAHEAAMDWMHNKGNELGSKITMAPGNLKYYAESMEKMVLDGYTEIYSNYVYENVWKDEDATLAYNEAKKFIDWFHENGYDNRDYAFSFLDIKAGRPVPPGDNKNYCGGTGNMLSMDWRGDLYPCIRYMESSIGTERPPLKIGNVNEGIGTTECTHDCIACLNAVTRRSESTDECFYCPVGSGCGWCSALNYQTFGTVNKRLVSICKMHKARTLAIVYYWNTFYKAHPKLKEHVDLWLPEKQAVKIVGQEEYDMLKELTLSVGGKVNNKELIKENDLDWKSLGKE